MAHRTIARNCALLGVATVLSAVSAMCLAQRSTPASPASVQKYKGIFEPMNCN
jgi:hypothetical protein